MSNLTALARQVSKCSTKGRRRYYTEKLKHEICAAAKKHGQCHVARKIGVTPSLICAWNNNFSVEADRMVPTSKSKVDALSLQELPHSTFNSLEGEQRPIIRLVSPAGVSMEINSTSEVNLPELINIFMRGQQ